MCSHVVTQMVDLPPCDVVIDEDNVPSEHVSEVVIIDQSPSTSQAGAYSTPQNKNNMPPTWATFNSLFIHKTSEMERWYRSSLVSCV